MIAEKVADLSTTILTGSSVKTPVERARELIARHPLIAFFALAYVFAWTIWFLIPQSTAIGVFGPPVAAVVISAILAPEKVKGSRARRWAGFAAVFAVALAVWVLISPVLAPQAALQPWYWLWLPGAVAAALVAFILSGPLADCRGVRDLFGSLAPRRVAWFWYVAALILGPVIWLLPIGLSLALGGQFPPWPNGAPSLELVLVAFAWIALFGGGLEEPGWRGFALPRMQSRWSPLVASVILGFFWALWHAPEYFTASGMWPGPAALAGILFRFVWVIPLAIVFTWLYNRSGRSGLLTVIVLHAAFNTGNYIVPLSPQAAVLFLGTTWAIALVVVVSARMWRHLKQSDAPLAPAPAGLAAKPQGAVV